MRYISLVAILLALPFTADAQRRSDDRRSGDRRSDQRQADQRQATQRQSEQRQPEQRQADRQAERRTEQRQTDQRPTTGLSPLGLQPAQTPRMPWWEQRQVPYWEQKQIPSWERPPSWQQPQAPIRNVAREMLDQQRDARRLANTPRPQHGQPPIVYVLPPYRYFPPSYGYGGYGFSSSTTYVTPSTTYVTPAPPEVVTQRPAPAQMPETGLLRLEVEPRAALQIFVDGLYLGTPADLGDEIELPLGTRRIELRAPGYRTLIFDTEIVPERAIVYRGALEPMVNKPQPPAAPLAPQAPAAPKAPTSNKMYMIQGCYLGNVMPTAAMLRPGCDLSKLTISP